MWGWKYVLLELYSTVDSCKSLPSAQKWHRRQPSPLFMLLSQGSSRNNGNGTSTVLCAHSRLVLKRKLKYLMLCKRLLKNRSLHCTISSYYNKIITLHIIISSFSSTVAWHASIIFSLVWLLTKSFARWRKLSLKQAYFFLLYFVSHVKLLWSTASCQQKWVYDFSLHASYIVLHHCAMFVVASHDKLYRQTKNTILDSATAAIAASIMLFATLTHKVVF